MSDYEYTEQLLRRQTAMRDELADICGVVDDPIPAPGLLHTDDPFALACFLVAMSLGLVIVGSLLYILGDAYGPAGVLVGIGTLIGLALSLEHLQ